MSTMDTFLYTDRGEATLEGLLIWFCTRVPFEHSDTCTEPGQLHCCEGKPQKWHAQSLQVDPISVGRFDNAEIVVQFHDFGGSVRLEPGDKISFRDGQFELETHDNRWNGSQARKDSGARG